VSMGNLRFSAIIEFFFRSIGAPPVEAVRGMGARINEFGRDLEANIKASQDHGSELRRLALDFRLLSSALRYLTQELGIQDTIWGRTTTKLSIAASTGTAFISAWNALGRMLDDDIARMKEVSLWLLAIIAAWTAFTETFDRVSGISSYRDQIKELTDDLKDLDAILRDVKIEQAGLNITSAALAYEQARINDAFAQGNITQEKHDQLIEAVNANMAHQNMLAAETRLITTRLTYDQLKQTDQIEDMNLAIERHYQRRNEVITQELIPGLFGTPQQRAGFASEAAGRLLGAMRGGAEPGTTLIISMDGAQIYGPEGVQSALEAGGQRILEWLRVRK